NPESTLVQLAAFPDLDSASMAVSRIIAAGILPASLEMMDNLTIQAVEPAYHAGYPMDAGGVLLVETDGLREEVAAIGDEITAICRNTYATEVRSATEKAERDLLWKGRKMALAAMGRLSPNYYLHDTVVPRSQLPATVARVREISTDYGLEIANVFHAGDGNLHPLMLFDRRKPGDVERVLEAGKEIITWCVSVGGALSGEHGIGTEKRGYMTMVYTGEDLAAMAGLRNAFDPGGRFNPGKVFPKGYMCGEVRALRAQALAQKYDIHPV
ncbi:MAG: FAD-linked oxidase C-terminal domain-containing protein, partial [Thermomicrobiales bacterium]